MYTKTRNDLETFLYMDGLWDDSKTSVEDLIDALGSDNWQIQQAALSAIGDRAELSALDSIMKLLNEQNGLKIYSNPDEWDSDSATSVAEKELWRCRYRVKQAALTAISKLIDKHGACIDDALLQNIMDYAVDMNEDFSVRRASCEILGKIKTPAIRAILEKASEDGETCTRVTAEAALKGFS